MKTVSIKSHDQLNGVGLCVIDGSQISDLRFNTGFMEERRVCKNADLKTRSDEGHGAIETKQVRDKTSRGNVSTRFLLLNSA